LLVAELPSSIEFLLDEFRGPSLDSDDVASRFRDGAFWNDLADQCGHALGHFAYVNRNESNAPDSLQFLAAGGLSPLSVDGKCERPFCRVAYADHFARTAGLFAERSLITDSVSWGALEFSPEEAFAQIAVLKRLEPLLRAGVIAFTVPAVGQCSACATSVRAAKKKISDSYWREFKRTATVFPFPYRNHWRLSFGSPLLVADGEETRLTIRVPKKSLSRWTPWLSLPRKATQAVVQEHSDFLKSELERFANNLVFEARMASFCKATVATNTALGAAGLRYLDERPFDTLRMAEMAAIRSLQLPEFECLGASGVLQLRDAASKALPAFRTRLRADLFSLSNLSDEGEEKQARKVAANLQQEAHELAGKLSAIRLPQGRRRERLYTSLSFALQLVALSTKNPALIVGAGGIFLNMLMNAHKSIVESAEKHEVLQHQPAYVLLAAKRIHGQH
jgi:hypothetical protein